MGTVWSKLSGDTNVFAFEVAFHTDPDEGEAIDATVGGSWGGFRFWVEGKNICDHLEYGESVGFVHWYLLPLLEWFAHNWDPLFHEERLPNRSDQDDAWSWLKDTRFPPLAVEDEKADQWEYAWSAWWGRHALRAARDGGLFPDIVFRRWRDLIELSWGQAPLAGMPREYRFVAETGLARLPVQAVAQAIFDVLESAVEHLSSMDPESDRIKNLRQKVRKLRIGKKESRLKWLAGLGVDEPSVTKGWKRIKEYFREYPETVTDYLFAAEQNELFISGSCCATLMFGSVSPNINKEDAFILARHMVDLYVPSPSETSPLDMLVRAEYFTPIERSAWEHGYQLAEDFLQEIEVIENEPDFIDISQIIIECGIQIYEIALNDPSVRGVSIAGPKHRSGILINTMHSANHSEYGYRFSLAHELCHLLFDRDRGRPLALASGPWAPNDIEKRANAFAAMVLMPIPLLRKKIARLTVPLESVEGIKDVANSLKTSFTATVRHLSNLGFIEEFEKESIERDTARKATEVATTEAPAVPLNEAFGRNDVVCMICGKEMKTLARHLRTAHGMEPIDYRKQFGIPRTQPLAARSYSESRRQMAEERESGANLAKARTVRGKEQKKK